MVHEQGYKDIETFLKVYSESKKIIEQWKKEKYMKKESIIKKLKELEKGASLYQERIGWHRNIER